jgi:hypothetical protein
MTIIYVQIAKIKYKFVFAPKHHAMKAYGGVAV